jgi:hypothetical protein
MAYLSCPVSGGKPSIRTNGGPACFQSGGDVKSTFSKMRPDAGAFSHFRAEISKGRRQSSLTFTLILF